MIDIKRVVVVSIVGLAFVAFFWGWYYSGKLTSTFPVLSKIQVLPDRFCSKYKSTDCPPGCKLVKYIIPPSQQPSAPFGLIAPPPPRCTGW